MEKSIKLRIVFMGTSEFARTVLKSLIDAKYNIVAVYTKPDGKIGREQELKKSSVKLLAQENNISVFDPEIFDEGVIHDLKILKPDLIVVVAYGKILPRQALMVPGFMAINVHASLLPKYRGASPIQNALLNGDKETGVSIMIMDEKVDTGALISQRSISVGDDETAEELSKRMSQMAAELLLETIPPWIERKIEPRVQDESTATICRLIEREDGKIIWDAEAKEIYNKFRAFFPWPGIYANWEKDGIFVRIKLNKIKLAENIAGIEEYHFGEVFRLAEKIMVKAGEDAVILEEVQMEGKKKVDIQDFINGQPNFVGSILK